MVVQLFEWASEISSRIVRNSHGSFCRQNRRPSSRACGSLHAKTHIHVRHHTSRPSKLIFLKTAKTAPGEFVASCCFLLTVHVRHNEDISCARCCRLGWSGFLLIATCQWCHPYSTKLRLGIRPIACSQGGEVVLGNARSAQVQAEGSTNPQLSTSKRNAGCCR